MAQNLEQILLLLRSKFWFSGGRRLTITPVPRDPAPVSLVGLLHTHGIHKLTEAHRTHTKRNES